MAPGAPSICPPLSPSIPQLWPSLVSVFQAKREWEGLEQRSREGLARCQKEAEARLRELRERVDSLPHQVGEGWGRGSPAHQLLGYPPTLRALQIEVVSDKCVLHKSDSDLKISAEGRAREFEVGAMRQELATLLSSVQLLREGNPGRKIAEIQGKLATVPRGPPRLSHSAEGAPGCPGSQTP